MTDVTILHEAEVELWEAVAYYEERSPGLGLDFEIEIERSLETIAEHSGRWPLRADGTRRYLAHRFPYLVVCALGFDSALVFWVRFLMLRFFQ